MSRLWTPPAVAADLRARTRQATAELRAMVRQDGGVLSFWNRELEKADPYLRLVQAYEKAEWPGLWPGYYHLIRWNPGAPPSVMPLHGPDGEWVEPSSQMLELLKQSDLQNTAAVHARRMHDERERQAAERAKERERDEMNDEVMQRLAAATRTQVSMNPDVPWAQNHAGERAAKGHRRKRGG